MDREFTFIEYINALFGWSVFARNEYQAANYDKFKQYLTYLDRAERKVQWKRGVGIKELPDMRQTRDLRKYLNEAEAATEYLSEFGDEFITTQKQIKLLSAQMQQKADPRTIESIKIKKLVLEKKVPTLKLKVESRLAILLEVLKNARAVIQKKPWEDPKELTLFENRKILQQFFKGKGFYKHLNVNEWVLHLEHLDLVRRDLYGFDLETVLLVHKDLTGTILKNANLRNTSFRNATLASADLMNADATGANFAGVAFLNTNLKGVNFKSADVTGADFTGAKGLVMGQVLQMRNVGQAKGLLVPKDLEIRSKLGAKGNINPKEAVITVAA